MKRSVTLVGAWLMSVGCVLWWAGYGRAVDPDCASCDCAEHEAWYLTGDSISTVLTVYDPLNPKTIGAAVKDARWKDMAPQKNKVYYAVCLSDNHKQEEQCRALLYNTSWSPICKRDGSQTDVGYIATKYDKDSSNYDFPPNNPLRNRYSCGATGLP